MKHWHVHQGERTLIYKRLGKPRTFRDWVVTIALILTCTACTLTLERNAPEPTLPLCEGVDKAVFCALDAQPRDCRCE